MPELPEVEVICRGIRSLLVGRRVTAISHSGKALRHPLPMEAMRCAMINQTITAVERRAKFLLISFSSGEMMIIHLGMTGKLAIFPPSAEPARHDHVFWTLDDDSELRYNDVRRFGSIRFLTADEVAGREETIFSTTGPEPFSEDFNAEYLQQLAKGRSLAVKLFLMTNQVVAGIGNIYANESLFAAGILPTRKAESLSKGQWKRLVTEVRRVLGEAIACGGSTISDFLNASRERGYFQMKFKVYGKQGQRCSCCSTEIVKIKIGGRASYYCPHCQK